MTILDQLAEHARERVLLAKEKVSYEEMRSLAEKRAAEKGSGTSAFAFEKALARNPDIAFICECKKASPSKGLIAPDFPYLQIAQDYETAGAEIASRVKVPCLRKDFTVDPYMIYEAKILGASAVLLIMSILPEKVAGEYLAVADSLGLSSLVETHNEEEVEAALRIGARIIGVNNRNLKDFSVDTENSRRLRERIPKDVLFVSESGVTCAEDVRKLREIGADAVLVGETLMRAEDKTGKLRELRS